MKLLGPGFSYTANSDFVGQDSFTIQVSGMLNGIRGSSDIRIIVSVGPNVSPQTSAIERSDRSPGDLSSAGQPNQNSTAQGSSAGEARADITIATGRRAQSDGITIATEHRYQSDNWRSAGEAHAGITTGHRSERITITIATGHWYQSDNWRWAGEAGQRGHVNAPLGCDR